MPGRPTKEFWDEVYPKVYDHYHKDYGETYSEGIARRTTASIWQKLTPAKRAKFEKLRKAREGKRKNPAEDMFVCHICHEPIDPVGNDFWINDEGMAHDECHYKLTEGTDMVSCGVCHKPIKITRDQHYFDDKTRKRYHTTCIVDVCPVCDRPIRKDQKVKTVKKQAYHDACAPEKHMFARKNGIFTVDKKSSDAMNAARKAAGVPKKEYRAFEEWYYEQYPPTFVEDAVKNPIELTKMDDFIKWWSQGLSLGLIKYDGTTVKGPNWNRFSDWWLHGMSLGIISNQPGLKIETGENIIDYIARNYTLGLITTGGKPSVLQDHADKMKKEDVAPWLKLPELPESIAKIGGAIPKVKKVKLPPLKMRENPDEVWADEDALVENPLPLLIPAALMAAEALGASGATAAVASAAPIAIDAAKRAAQAPTPAPASVAPSQGPKGPQAPQTLKPNPGRDVHYILVGDSGKVYANKFGPKAQADAEAHEIFRRSGISVKIVYPDEVRRTEVHRVGSILKGK